MRVESVCVVCMSSECLFCFTLCCMDLENGDGCKSTLACSWVKTTDGESGNYKSLALEVLPCQIGQ